MSLKSKLAPRFLLGLVVFGAMLFVPAGSLRYWQGWAYLVVWFVPALFAFGYFCKHDPQLIERRMQRKEKVREQKLIMTFAFVTWLIGYLLPGLDHRFGWSHLPLWLTILSQAFVLAGYLTIFWVLKANSFAGSTIRVEPGQKVISSGPYRIVRHPMYLGGSVMFLFAPLALGSYFALPVFALFIPIIVLRLLNEEKILRQELPGYAEYCLHTRFRLIPLLW
ncbi:MAG: isoprenylcysteine carboxylmethyltransferase family protein [Candidatus Sulfotelmatobacter sp.]|jgi:protein-S-isoprenylcysteine O-methyltransferase Ste14